jgi:predicted transglutaminase-like cysteine proteinase
MIAASIAATNSKATILTSAAVIWPQIWTDVQKDHSRFCDVRSVATRFYKVTTPCRARLKKATDYPNTDTEMLTGSK